MSKHPHYELLNLLGYGLAKFYDKLYKNFNMLQIWVYRYSFFRYHITGVVKNRMDYSTHILNNWDER